MRTEGQRKPLGQWNWLDTKRLAHIRDIECFVFHQAADFFRPDGWQKLSGAGSAWRPRSAVAPETAGSRAAAVRRPSRPPGGSRRSGSVAVRQRRCLSRHATATPGRPGYTLLRHPGGSAARGSDRQPEAAIRAAVAAGPPAAGHYLHPVRHKSSSGAASPLAGRPRKGRLPPPTRRCHDCLANG